MFALNRMDMSLLAFCTLSIEGFDSKNTFIMVVCTHGFVFGCWCVNSKFGKRFTNHCITDCSICRLKSGNSYSTLGVLCMTLHEHRGIAHRLVRLNSFVFFLNRMANSTLELVP